MTVSKYIEKNGHIWSGVRTHAVQQLQKYENFWFVSKKSMYSQNTYILLRLIFLNRRNTVDSLLIILVLLWLLKNVGIFNWRVNDANNNYFRISDTWQY